MKNMRKVLFACCSVLAAGCFAFGLNSFQTASAEATTYEGFELGGASVRMVSPIGIRFRTSVPEEIKDDYTFGTLFIPKAELGDNPLTIDTEEAAKFQMDANGKWQTKEEGKPWVYVGVLGGVNGQGEITEFPASQYNAEIVARSFALNANGEVVYYTAPQTRTVAGTASKALATTKGDNVITDVDNRSTLSGICDYVLGDDGFAFAESALAITNQTTIDLDGLFASTNGNEGLTAIWEITAGDSIALTYDEYGIATAATVEKPGEATLKATIGTKTAELTVNVDAKAFYANALQFNDENSVDLVEIAYADEPYAAPSIVTDGDRTVLAGSLSTCSKLGSRAALTISVGGNYTASQIAKITITYKCVAVSTTNQFLMYLGANNTSSGRTQVTSTSFQGTHSEYQTLEIDGAAFVSAFGSGDTVLNNIAFYNNTNGGVKQERTLYIDSIVISEVVDYANLLQFNDENSLKLVEIAYADEPYAAPSIVTDGDRTVLAGSCSTCSKLGSRAALTISVGGNYTASQISKITVTYKCVATSYTAGGFDFYVGANNTLESGRTKILKTSINGTHSEYQTLEIDGASFVSAFGSGDTVLNNIAFYNGTKQSSAQYRTLYIDSIVITLAE